MRFKNNRKTLLFFLLILVALTSCKKFWCKHDESAFKIVDVRVGEGQKGLEKIKKDFLITEKIWVTYDVKNMVAMRVDGTPYFWIRQDMIVRDKHDAVVLSKPGVLNINKEISKKPAKFINEISLRAVSGLKPGKYTLTVLVTDLVGFQTDIETTTITLK